MHPRAAAAQHAAAFDASSIAVGVRRDGVRASSARGSTTTHQSVLLYGFSCRGEDTIPGQHTFSLACSLALWSSLAHGRFQDGCGAAVLGSSALHTPIYLVLLSRACCKSVSAGPALCWQPQGALTCCAKHVSSVFHAC